MYDPKEYSEIAVSKGSIMRKDAVRPSQVYIDIGFPNGEKFDTLLFQNFYTSSISITQQSSSGNSPILDNYVLMPNAFSESGAQLWFAIDSSSFSSEFIKGKPIRIVLFQPSAQWHKFEIRNIKALCKIAPSVSVAVDKGPTKVDSISELLWSDYKILYEATRNAQYAGSLPDAVYVYSEGRKSSKKKDRRKKSMAMTNNPSSNSFV